MKHPFQSYFPTPSYLLMSSCALDISDQSIKYGELLSSSAGLRLGRFGKSNIPEGIIVSGKIENETELARILKVLAVKEKLHFVRISLPEEQLYLFTIELPKISAENLRESILLSLEEHIPLKASDTTFDFAVVNENDKSMFVEVLATATATIENYLSVFRKAGLVPLSFELEAQAIARAVIPFGDPSAVMIVDFGEARTGASIAHDGRVFFSTTLDIGGNSLTNMIAKNFNISIEEAEKMKRSYGLNTTANADDIFPAILSGISVLKDELNRHYIYWKTHEDDGTKHEKLDRIILCGGDANLIGLSDYLEASMGIKAQNANAWINITDMKTSIPDMGFEESFGYATVLGLALADYKKHRSMINVLPEKEKRSLRREYAMRFASIAVSSLALASLIAIILILPSYFFSISKSNIATARLEAYDTANPEIANNNLSIIKDINAKIALLSKDDGGPIVSDIILRDILESLPKGIKITSMLYNEDQKTKTISIGGTAADRTTLRDFKTSLDSNPDFKSVDLPISDFIGRSDISFNMTITLK